jgi:thiamine transporter ThiT
MKITNKSKKLIAFFHKYNCLPHIKQTNLTDSIFKHFFHEINDAVNFVSYTKSQMGSTFYKLKINKIDHVNQIPKPTTFNANFPNLFVNI